MHPYKCKHQQLILHPSRAVYWQEESALILSDLHFGKTGHFRSAGIAIPQNIYKEDLQRLVTLIQFFKPDQLIMVGDLFHSRPNKELEWFRRWRKDFSTTRFHLIKGNHDILDAGWYEEAGMTVYTEEMVIRDFCFRHHPGADNGLFTFTGHLHPGISIRGMGKQSLHFPCFYFTENQCVLPAFSRFTGTYSIAPKKGETVFAIVKDSIMRVA